METLTLKGKIDEAGQLILAESIQLTPGEVEVTISKPVQADALASQPDEQSSSESDNASKSKVKALSDWFKTVQPAPSEFDADAAKWSYLREKHNL